MPPPPPPPRATTTGASDSTQVEPVVDLAGRSTVLRTESSAVILHCSWNPVDPDCLATAGQRGGVSCIWNIVSPKTEDAAAPARPRSESRILLTADDDDAGAGWEASDLCWNASGTHLAVATYNDGDVFDSRVTIWRKDGVVDGGFTPPAMPVLTLRWGPVGTLLLGVCSDGETSDVRIWEPGTGETLGSVAFPSLVEYASWMSEDNFILAGGRALELYQFDSRMNYLQRLPVPSEAEIWLFRPEPVRGIVATASSQFTVDVSWPPFFLRGGFFSFYNH